MPVTVEEGTEAWGRWLSVIPWKDVMNILYQQFGWPSTVIVIFLAVLWWLYYYPPKFLSHLSQSFRAVRPMSGIPELERCHQELVKYIGAPSDGYPISRKDIAASAKFVPYLIRLCHILDEQDIPHPPPPNPNSLVFTGTGEWVYFLSSLWAVCHDLEKARKAFNPKS